jgi:hypothetical protein
MLPDYKSIVAINFLFAQLCHAVVNPIVHLPYVFPRFHIVKPIVAIGIRKSRR